jgi:hypothetical protein
MDTQTLPHLNAVQLTAKPNYRSGYLLLFLCLLLSGSALFYLDAVLPLRDLWFYNALLTVPWRNWLLLPAHLLFPGLPTLSVLPGVHRVRPSSMTIPWLETSLLLPGFCFLFTGYLLAVRYLPRYLSQRGIILSTLLLGLLYILIPVATSQDLFSYIAYARMLFVYHFNPLVLPPTAIPHDIIYRYIYWVHQPSIYGPVWVWLCGILLEITLHMGFTHVASMVLMLRLFSLAMHLGSVQLIWSISGYMQRTTPYSASSQQQRIRATLAFAWNPFLLFEAAVNAHVDITMLFFVLLSVWLLLPHMRYPILSTALSAFMLALASSIKITLIFFIPGLLLFLFLRYMQRWTHISLALLAYGGTLLLLYVPFWDGGKILDVLSINPGAFHAINSPYAVFVYLTAALTGSSVLPQAVSAASPIEHIAHSVSMALLGLGYLALLFLALKTWQRQILFSVLLRWMALVWLFYCALGSPWFWPWYIVTFLGLYALIEAGSVEHGPLARLFRLPLTVRLLSFSSLCVYCFVSFAPAMNFIAGLKHFTWGDLAGAWLWLVPLLGLRPSTLPRLRRARQGTGYPKEDAPTMITGKNNIISQ